MTIFVLCLVIVAYIVLVVGVALLQRRMIYFPGKISEESARQVAASAGIIPWQNKSGQIIGWLLPASSAPIGTVLVAHGNAASALDREYFRDPIHQAAALDVYVLEYPGYGPRPGSPSQTSFYAAAEEAFDNLPSQRPIYLVSESLGAGVVSHIAMLHPDRVAGLALFAPYNNLAAVAQSHMPFLPASLILRDRFDPSTDLQHYRGPIKFILAGSDEVIPTKFGKSLYDGYSGPKSLQIIPNAHHNEIARQSPDWWREVLSFWQQHPATSEK